MPRGGCHIRYYTIVPALPYSSLRWKFATDGAKGSANVGATVQSKFRIAALICAACPGVRGAPR
jgi:hypothetical protein